MAGIKNTDTDRIQTLTSIVDDLPGMAYICSYQGNKWHKTYISRGAYDLLGYAPESLVNSRDVEFDELIYAQDRDRVWAAIGEAIRHKTGFEITYRVHHKDAGMRWVWERGSVKYHDDSTVNEIQGFITDITAQKETETDLARQKILLRSILDSLVESVVVVDQEGVIQVVNQSWAGFATANDASNAVVQGIGINYLDVCKPAIDQGEKDVCEIRDGIEAVLNGKQTEFAYEYPCHSPGKKRWFRMHAARFNDGISGAVISHFDITRLRHIQHELEQLNSELEQRVNQRTIELSLINKDLVDEVARHKITEAELQRFRLALDSSSDSIYIIDPHKMKFVDVNRTGWEILGYSKNEILAMGPEDLKPESVIPELRDKLDQVMSGNLVEAVLDTTHRCRDGRLIPVEVRLRLAKISSANEIIVASARDITERKKNEKTLLASERRFRLLFDNLPLGVSLADENGRYIVVNPSMCEMLGYEAEELTSGMGIEDVIHPDDATVNRHLMRRVNEAGGSGYTLEQRYVKKTQETIWANLITKVVQESGSRPISLGIYQDITEKRKSEQALLENRETLRVLLDAAEDDFFMLLDKDGVVVQLNQSMADSLGVRIDSIIGKNIFNYFPKDVAELRREWMRIACEEKIPVGYEDSRDGRYFYTKLYPILNQQREIVRVAVLARDITDVKIVSERRLMQEREHREALVREVHHRIKNNLQSVSGLLRRQCRIKPALSEILQDAISQVEVVAIVHGIQGSETEGHLFLCEMVPKIARTAIELCGEDIRYDFSNELSNLVIIVNEEAVAIALIINELVTNALKHGASTDRILNIILRGADIRVEMQIINHGVLPEMFDFEKDHKLGTGLKLVRSLMPEKGVDIEFRVVDSSVITRLLLSEPVVTYDLGTCAKR